MNIKSKKGYVLVFAAIFTLTLMIASWGLWTYVSHLVQETKVEEYHSIQGYYATVAGLRYGYLLLRDPSALIFTEGVCTIPRTGNTADETFFEAINIDLSDLTITIEKITSGPDIGKYTVTAIYSS